MTLCEKLSKGVFEVQLCVLAANSVPGKALDLGTLDGSISSLMKDAAEKYKADFPPVVFETPAHKVQYSTDLEVLTSKVVVDESDYRHQLATFNTAAQQHEDASISEYINHRIVLIADALAVDTSIADKLKKVSILQEKKRKLVTYEVAIDGQLPWNVIKKRRFNVFSGAGPALDKERLDVTMKEVYRAVHNCDEDVLVVTCKLDTHKKANVVESVKASLTSNGISKKHMLVVGTIEQDTNETLARFKKGKKAFGARVEDKIVACSIEGFQGGERENEVFAGRHVLQSLAHPGAPRVHDGADRRGAGLVRCLPFARCNTEWLHAVSVFRLIVRSRPCARSLGWSFIFLMFLSCSFLELSRSLLCSCFVLLLLLHSFPGRENLRGSHAVRGGRARPGQ
jgi:hypothetical protein